MVNEREMILKSQIDAEDIDPLYQVCDLHKADDARRRLEEKIKNYKLLWDGKLEVTKEDL